MRWERIALDLVMLCPVKFSSEHLSFSSRACPHLPAVVHWASTGLACLHGGPSQLSIFIGISGAPSHHPDAWGNLTAVATCFLF